MFLKRVCHWRIVYFLKAHVSSKCTIDLRVKRKCVGGVHCRATVCKLPVRSALPKCVPVAHSSVWCGKFLHEEKYKNNSSNAANSSASCRLFVRDRSGGLRREGKCGKATARSWEFASFANCALRKVRNALPWPLTITVLERNCVRW